MPHSNARVISPPTYRVSLGANTVQTNQIHSLELQSVLLAPHMNQVEVTRQPRLGSK